MNTLRNMAAVSLAALALPSTALAEFKPSAELRSAYRAPVRFVVEAHVLGRYPRDGHVRGHTSIVAFGGQCPQLEAKTRNGGRNSQHRRTTR